MIAHRTTLPALELRPVYTVEQFASEVLCGNRHPNWVRAECKAKRIATCGRRPWLIKGSEARRFTGI